MSNFFEQPDDTTPLTPAETLDLIPAHIATRDELNRAEQENIVRGQAWALRSRTELLSEAFVRELHKQMLGDVWRWAGKFRTSERSRSIEYWEIPAAVHQVLVDTRSWIECRTYPPDEIAVRFHHRLVQIHPFPNGNGRHSRLMADLLIMELGGERFSWGSEQVETAGEVRERYIMALQAANQHGYPPLLAFARS